MIATVVAFVMSIIELIELLTRWSLGIGQQWVEAVLIALTPILVWLIPGWTESRRA